jgi:hypothetical protein
MSRMAQLAGWTGIVFRVACVGENARMVGLEYSLSWFDVIR